MIMRGQYYFLSNMFPCSIRLQVPGDTEMREYSCAECAFQAAKDPRRAAEFTSIDGFQAKKLGRRVTIQNVAKWNEERNRWMEQIVNAKFSQHPDLARQLCRIQGPIVEDSKNDRYWGCVNGRGENHLGKILMRQRVREMAKQNHPLLNVTRGIVIVPVSLQTKRTDRDMAIFTNRYPQMLQAKNTILIQNPDGLNGKVKMVQLNRNLAGALVFYESETAKTAALQTAVNKIEGRYPRWPIFALSSTGLSAQHNSNLKLLQIETDTKAPTDQKPVFYIKEERKTESEMQMQ